MDREYAVRYWIKNMLVGAMWCAKKNQKYSAISYIENLRGMLYYMLSVGDISEYTRNKVYNLTRIVVRKYDLY